jgi:hypothetical protein
MQEILILKKYSIHLGVYLLKRSLSPRLLRKFNKKRTLTTISYRIEKEEGVRILPTANTSMRSIMLKYSIPLKKPLGNVLSLLSQERKDKARF